jgi:multicomponent K+:H+ antiporter subunit E
MSLAVLKRIQRRLLPHPWLSLVLILVWLLLANGVSWGQAILGGLLGWAIPLYTHAYWPEPVRLHRPWTLVRFLALIIYDIALANLAVAWIVIWRPRRVRPGFVELPLDLKTDMAITVFANTISLTPGTVSVYLSKDRRTLVVHALDLKDPGLLAAGLKARYEAPLKEIFES